METQKAILAKLHAIMSNVGIIGKDKRNNFHHYDYASEYAIKLAIQKLLIEHKVMFIPTIEECINLDGAKGMLTTIKMQYRFYDVESGESITGYFNGSGEDKADKGLYKAITGAIKYILTSTFLIPTGDDPENQPTTANNSTPTTNESTQAPAAKKEYPEDDRPWLDERLFNNLLKGANAGQVEAVQAEMDKYKMEKVFRTALNSAMGN